MSKAGSVPGRVWRTSHQTTLGLGHPATVQCSFRVLPSHTVCPRGLMMNSGGCVRLSGFIFLRNSDHSSICSERVKSGLHVNVRMCSITTRIQIRLGGIYRPGQFHPLCRLPDVHRPGFLLHLDFHGLLGLPDKQVPHGHIVDPLLCGFLLLGLDQTANNIMAEVETDKQFRGKQETIPMRSQTVVNGPCELAPSRTRPFCFSFTHLALNTGIT